MMFLFFVSCFLFCGGGELVSWWLGLVDLGDLVDRWMGSVLVVATAALCKDGFNVYLLFQGTSEI
jgi:hypothetical protein